VPIDQQRNVTMLILPIPIPNAIGSIGIGSLQGKIKLGSFEKLIIVSDSSTPPNFDRTLLKKNSCFQKKLFLTKK
jgi:hypothetical protein